LGLDGQMREPKIIQDLCYKQIISFGNDLFFVMEKFTVRVEKIEEI
jgi:hypothetical protein